MICRVSRLFRPVFLESNSSLVSRRALYPQISSSIISLGQSTRMATSSATAGSKAKAEPRRIKVYTKTGDKGKSSLYDGSRAEKDDRFFMALGDVDELNSTIGVCYEHCVIEGNGMSEELAEIQSRLLDVGTAVATPSKPEAEQDRLARAAFADDATQALEDRIDAMDTALPPLRNFILPSGGLASAHLHVARTVCRRAERRVTGLVREGLVQASVQRYLNRLSDYLFTAARAAAQAAGKAETVYKKAAAPAAAEAKAASGGGAEGEEA